ncbi:Coronin-1C [Strongyloides ratti]|uniref:Coronin n=1 Tax=Strongyloides ratti TaxID=34506 RepID=A0A090MY96_STRRB|nr:Coronin-1C [Strongyloides ratti]CEF66799.1 Coronin-1C [Strongyloides ratti]
MNIVRQSKYRHVFCKPLKHESCMSDIKVTEVSWDSLFCAVNPKFIAFVVRGSGGPFLVVPVNKIGRIDKDYPYVDAHKAPCLEIVWSPFNDNVIASCSEDTTVKVWLIPDRGLTRTLSEPVVELTGHQKRVNTLVWHPTANNILLTAGGENKILMWNVGTGEALLEVDGHPDQIFSLSFNYDGSQFITACKDKKLRIFDSHSGQLIKEGSGHEGVKPQRAIFLKDGKVFTTGFTKRSERLFALRNPENLSEPIIQEELDTSNAVLFPLYDEDTNLLWLAGKGDCAIRYYEINDERPYVHYINTYTTSEPQRAIGFQSKRAMNYNENETARIYKLTTKGVVDVLQFFVPRKSDLYQADLYPDTRSLVPAMTAEEFVEGKNAPPNLMVVNPNAAEASKPKIQVAKKANILNQLQPSAQTTTPSPQPSPQPTRHRPVVDDDMGIVMQSQQSQRQEQRQEPRQESRREHKREPSPGKGFNGNPTPRQQVQLKSREDHDGGRNMTAGQRRAAAELERIKRNQREAPPPEEASPPRGGFQSRQHGSASSLSTDQGMPSGPEEMYMEIQRLKQVLRSHERRIRLLEDQLADFSMSNTYGL